MLVYFGRFDGGSAAALASHDYRIAQASGRSDTTQLESELLLTLKKSGKSISPLSASSGIISGKVFSFRFRLASIRHFYEFRRGQS